MIKLYSYFLLFSLTFSLGYTQSRKNMLFLGNSYTAVNNLPQLLYNLALGTADTIDFDSNTPGGYTFNLHTTNATSLAKIQQKPWDYVILQEQSQLPSFSPAQVATDVFPYAKILDSLIHKNNACAKTVFYMTWGRKYGDAQNCASYPPVCTYAGMSGRLRNSYVQMADMNEALVAPAGMAWMASRAADSTINLWSADNSHPSIEGSYLTACVFYATIYEKTPVGLPFTAGLPQTTAGFLQQIAHQTVFDSLSVWNINEFEPQAGFAFSTNGYGLFLQNTTQGASSFWWNFGNGDTATGFQPEYTYSQPGTHPLTQIVTDGCTQDTLTQTITLNSPQNAWNMAGMLGKGMNLSYLENYWAGNPAIGYANYIHNLPDVSTFREDIDLMNQMGFQTLRLPVCFDVWAGDSAPYTIDSVSYFTLVDSFILWTSEKGMKIIVDYHHGKLDSASFDKDLEKIQALWVQIATRYAGTDPEQVLFEVYNEPWNLTASQWKQAATRLCQTIHALDPERMLITGGHNWNSSWGLEVMGALPDSNLIYTFHDYSPMIFTHQGASWVGDPVATTGIPFPYNAATMPPIAANSIGTWGEPAYNSYNVWGNADSLASGIGHIKKWSNLTSLPVFCGEWGSFKPYIPDDGSRCRYTEAVKTALDSFAIPYTYWEWNQGFSLFDGSPSLDSISVCMADIWDITLTDITPETVFPVRIYPNPSESRIQIETLTGETPFERMTLCDITGKVLYSGEFRSFISVKELPSGVYILELSGGSRKNTYKIIRQ
ncbi:MAG: cellulase family glycosylhydrolase [Bacteroidia bacterium]|nr:cellulase family glycosylhydrolase [Bacteroidia bacterium]